MLTKKKHSKPLYPNTLRLLEPHRTTISFANLAQCLCVEAVLNLCCLQYTIYYEDEKNDKQYPLLTHAAMGSFSGLQDILKFLKYHEILPSVNLSSSIRNDINEFLLTVNNEFSEIEWNFQLDGETNYVFSDNLTSNLKSLLYYFSKRSTLSASVEKSFLDLCDKISEALLHKVYVFANMPTEADAVLLGHLVAFCTCSYWKILCTSFPRLSYYIYEREVGFLSICRSGGNQTILQDLYHRKIKFSRNYQCKSNTHINVCTSYLAKRTIQSNEGLQSVLNTTKARYHNKPVQMDLMCRLSNFNESISTNSTTSSAILSRSFDYYLDSHSSNSSCHACKNRRKQKHINCQSRKAIVCYCCDSGSDDSIHLSYSQKISLSNGHIENSGSKFKINIFQELDVSMPCESRSNMKIGSCSITNGTSSSDDTSPEHFDSEESLPTPRQCLLPINLEIKNHTYETTAPLEGTSDCESETLVVDIVEESFECVIESSSTTTSSSESNNDNALPEECSSESPVDVNSPKHANVESVENKTCTYVKCILSVSNLSEMNIPSDAFNEDESQSSSNDTDSDIASVGIVNENPRSDVKSVSTTSSSTEIQSNAFEESVARNENENQTQIVTTDDVDEFPHNIRSSISVSNSSEINSIIANPIENVLVNSIDHTCQNASFYRVDENPQYDVEPSTTISNLSEALQEIPAENLSKNAIKDCLPKNATVIEVENKSVNDISCTPTLSFSFEIRSPEIFCEDLVENTQNDVACQGASTDSMDEGSLYDVECFSAISNSSEICSDDVIPEDISENLVNERQVVSANRIQEKSLSDISNVSTISNGNEMNRTVAKLKENTSQNIALIDGAAINLINFQKDCIRGVQSASVVSNSNEVISTDVLIPEMVSENTDSKQKEAMRVDKILENFSECESNKFQEEVLQCTSIISNASEVIDIDELKGEIKSQDIEKDLRPDVSVEKILKKSLYGVEYSTSESKEIAFDEPCNDNVEENVSNDIHSGICSIDRIKKLKTFDVQCSSVLSNSSEVILVDELIAEIISEDAKNECGCDVASIDQIQDKIQQDVAQSPILSNSSKVHVPNEQLCENLSDDDINFKPEIISGDRVLRAHLCDAEYTSITLNLTDVNNSKEYESVSLFRIDSTPSLCSQLVECKSELANVNEDKDISTDVNPPKMDISNELAKENLSGNISDCLLLNRALGADAIAVEPLVEPQSASKLSNAEVKESLLINISDQKSPNIPSLFKDLPSISSSHSAQFCIPEDSSRKESSELDSQLCSPYGNMDKIDDGVRYERINNSEILVPEKLLLLELSVDTLSQNASDTLVDVKHSVIFFSNLYLAHFNAQQINIYFEEESVANVIELHQNNAQTFFSNNRNLGENYNVYQNNVLFSVQSITFDKDRFDHESLVIDFESFEEITNVSSINELDGKLNDHFEMTVSFCHLQSRDWLSLNILNVKSGFCQCNISLANSECSLLNLSQCYSILNEIEAQSIEGNYLMPLRDLLCRKVSLSMHECLSDSSLIYHENDQISTLNSQSIVEYADSEIRNRSEIVSQSEIVELANGNPNGFTVSVTLRSNCKISGSVNIVYDSVRQLHSACDCNGSSSQWDSTFWETTASLSTDNEGLIPNDEADYFLFET